MRIIFEADTSEANNGFDSLEAGLRNAIDSALYLCGLNAVEGAKQVVHVITGNLRDSITILDRGENYIEVGTAVSYAAAEEFGNQYRPPHEYMGPQADRLQSEGPEILLGEIRKIPI